MKKTVFIKVISVFVGLFVLALAGLLAVFLTPPTYEVEYNMEYVDGMEILLTYKVVDQWGVALTSYETVHEKEMHLIGVRTDLYEFVHVHPEMAWDGEWSVDIDFPTEGPYEFYADFTPKDGEPRVLRFTVSVGEFVREKLGSYPQETEGYQFTYHFPETVEAGELAYSITLEKDGEPVTVFEDYLGAKGHSVVIQEDTLNYEHAHAEGEEAPSFAAHFSEEGRYAIFTQVQVGGEVLTLPYLLYVEAGEEKEGMKMDGGGH